MGKNIEKSIEKRGIFEHLYGINVGEHLDTKGGFKYLKWSVAFRILLQNYPKSHWRVLKQDEIDIGVDLSIVKGSIVATEITVVGTDETVTRTEFLPVLNYKNSIMVDPSTMDINSSIKRCYVKTLAHLGLGMGVYEGADYPEDCTEPNDDIGQSFVSKEENLRKNEEKIINEFSKEVQQTISHDQQKDFVAHVTESNMEVSTAIELIKLHGFKKTKDIPIDKLETLKREITLIAKGAVHAGA